MESVPVVILCGGLGMRLREETEYRPKPMVPIGDKPILWHIMKGFAVQGFCDFVLCLGYRGEVIRRYFLDYEAMNADVTIELGSKRMVVHDQIGERGWRVTLAETGERAQTGARVARVQRYVNGRTFIVTYGDGLANVVLRRLMEFHRQRNTVATITAVHPGHARFGEMDIADHRVRSFQEKPLRAGSLINGGYLVCEPSIFRYLSTDDSCVLEREPLQRLAADGQLSAYHHQGYWVCMDTYRDYLALNDMWATGIHPWTELPQEAKAAVGLS